MSEKQIVGVDIGRGSVKYYSKFKEEEVMSVATYMEWFFAIFLSVSMVVTAIACAVCLYKLFKEE